MRWTKEVMHRLQRETTIPRELRDVFEFFSNAANLEVITPPAMRLKVLNEMPLEMKPGVLIDYRLRIGGWPFRWQSRISSWDPPHEFVDEQVSGPYRDWVHTHTFRGTPEGTSMSDSVSFRLPFWPPGEIAYPMVRWQLDRIFGYRERTITRLLVGRDTLRAARRLTKFSQTE